MARSPKAAPATTSAGKKASAPAPAKKAATTKAPAPATRSGAKQAAKPVAKQAAKKAAPAKKQAAPPKKQAAPPKKQAAPPKKQAAPSKATAKKTTAAGGARAASKADTKVAKNEAPVKAQAKAPATKATAARKAGGSTGDKFLDEARALLLAERREYEEQAQSLKAQADSLAQEMEPGDIQFDEESGEGGTMNIDRERDLALSAQARAAVDEIDHALAKIGSGTYGNCERCGQPIPKARLKALPHARLCVACKSGGLSRR
jgi:DnaK suppressor protein